MQHPMQEFLKTQLLEWFQGVDIGDPEVVLNKARLSRTFFILVIECQNMQIGKATWMIYLRIFLDINRWLLYNINVLWKNSAYSMCK